MNIFSFILFKAFNVLIKSILCRDKIKELVEKFFIKIFNQCLQSCLVFRKTRCFEAWAQLGLVRSILSSFWAWIGWNCSTVFLNQKLYFRQKLSCWGRSWVAKVSLRHWGHLSTLKRYVCTKIRQKARRETMKNY